MAFKYFCVLLAISLTFAEDLSETEDVSETSREIRDYNQDWRGVEYYQQQDWIPQSQSSPEPSLEEQPKRRRLRKRKRRPLVITSSEESPEDERLPTPRRRIRPQRLDQIKESWEEMSAEVGQKPYIRRKVTPIYQESQSGSYERVRDPFTALQEAEEKQKKKTEEVIQQTTNAPDLKALLKQTGGALSLSEILQQKNLSLSELLMGNQKAISALTEKSDTVTEVIIENKSATEFQPIDSTKYKRLPPSIGLRKNINRNFEQNIESEEILSSREMLEAQRKRLAILHSHKENKIYSDLKKFEVQTEATTEKRIFVPSHPKYYTSLDYKPEIDQNDDEITERYEEMRTKPIEFVTTSTIPPTTTAKRVEIKRISFRPKLRGNLPITSAKLNKFGIKPQTTTENYPTFPPTAIKIDINDIFGFKQSNNRNKTTQIDEPFKMTIDLDDMMKTTTQIEDGDNTIRYETKIKSEKWEITPTTPVGEKLKHVTAKEEIMEILRDPITRDNLSKILQTRNMTVDELVEQRERGSSQLHLADIFHNKTREPEPKDEPFIGHMNSDYFNNFPVFQRQQKSRIFPLDTNLEIKPLAIIKNENKTEITKPRELYTVTSFPTYKIEMDKTLMDKPQPFLPIWKQLYPDFFPKVHEINNHEIGIDTKATTIVSNSVDRLEEIENKLADSSHDRLNIDLNRELYEEEFISLPSGVKSAIIASSAIIGLSLLVFLTILFIFKWSQKQKQRLIYSRSFSGSKIKSPILESIQKRSLRSFMSETLGRKKNYYKSHMQSMTDSIWENDKKPYL